MGYRPPCYKGRGSTRAGMVGPKDAGDEGRCPEGARKPARDRAGYPISLAAGASSAHSRACPRWSVPEALTRCRREPPGAGKPAPCTPPCAERESLRHAERCDVGGAQRGRGRDSGAWRRDSRDAMHAGTQPRTASAGERSEHRAARDAKRRQPLEPRTRLSDLSRLHTTAVPSADAADRAGMPARAGICLHQQESLRGTASSVS